MEPIIFFTLITLSLGATVEGSPIEGSATTPAETSPAGDDVFLTRCDCYFRPHCESISPTNCCKKYSGYG